MSEQEELLMPYEVAAIFRVNAKTVTRWARDGKLTCIRTLGGHRRYRRSEVYALLGKRKQPTEAEVRAEVGKMLRQGVSIDQLIKTIRGTS